MTLNSEELLCLHLRSRSEVITWPPCKTSITRNRNFVGVAEVKDPRVGVLRSTLDKNCTRLGDGHVQRLAAEDEKVPAVLQIIFDCLPGIGRHSRTVREHQKAGLLERAGGRQGLQIHEG